MGGGLGIRSTHHSQRDSADDGRCAGAGNCARGMNNELGTSPDFIVALFGGCMVRGVTQARYNLVDTVFRFFRRAQGRVHPLLDSFSGARALAPAGPSLAAVQPVALADEVPRTFSFNSVASLFSMCKL